MARKDEYIRVLNHETPTRFVQPTDFHMAFTPGEHNMGGEPDEKGRIIGKDWFGCTWAEIGKGAIDGATLVPNQEPLEDLADYKEAGLIPTKEQIAAFDWESYAKEQLEGYDPEEQVLQVRSLIGPFERMHCLVGFENALCAFYEDPEAVEDFFRDMLEYKKTIVDYAVEYMHPDVLVFDDDYGTGRAPFMDPEMWREFFPDFWKELVEYVHSKGVYAELHSCGYVTPLVGDFVEAGFDILQPVQTNNDLKQIKELWGDKIILRMAIFDKKIDVLNQTEDEIRADIRSYYEILAPGGNFLPDLVPIADRYYVIQEEMQNIIEKEMYGVERDGLPFQWFFDMFGVK